MATAYLKNGKAFVTQGGAIVLGDCCCDGCTKPHAIVVIKVEAASEVKLSDSTAKRNGQLNLSFGGHGVGVTQVSEENADPAGFESRCGAGGCTETWQTDCGGDKPKTSVLSVEAGTWEGDSGVYVCEFWEAGTLSIGYTPTIFRYYVGAQDCSYCGVFRQNVKITVYCPVIQRAKKAGGANVVTIQATGQAPQQWVATEFGGFSADVNTDAGTTITVKLEAN